MYNNNKRRSSTAEPPRTLQFTAPPKSKRSVNYCSKKLTYLNWLGMVFERVSHFEENLYKFVFLNFLDRRLRNPLLPLVRWRSWEGLSGDISRIQCLRANHLVLRGCSTFGACRIHYAQPRHWFSSLCHVCKLGWVPSKCSVFKRLISYWQYLVAVTRGFYDSAFIVSRGWQSNFENDFNQVVDFVGYYYFNVSKGKIPRFIEHYQKTHVINPRLPCQ